MNTTNKPLASRFKVYGKPAMAFLLSIAAFGSSLALADTPPANGIGRTEIVRHDFADSGREAVQVRVDLPRGAAFPKHSHPGVEIAYVLKGTLQYQLGDQAPVTLQAGEALYIPEGTSHSAKNVGDGDASELATYIVTKDKPIVELSK